MNDGEEKLSIKENKQFMWIYKIEIYFNLVLKNDMYKSNTKPYDPMNKNLDARSETSAILACCDQRDRRFDYTYLILVLTIYIHVHKVMLDQRKLY